MNSNDDGVALPSFAGRDGDIEEPIAPAADNVQESERDRAMRLQELANNLLGGARRRSSVEHSQVFESDRTPGTVFDAAERIGKEAAKLRARQRKQRRIGEHRGLQPEPRYPRRRICSDDVDDYDDDNDDDVDEKEADITGNNQDQDRARSIPNSFAASLACVRQNTTCAGGLWKDVSAEDMCALFLFALP